MENLENIRPLRKIETEKRTEEKSDVEIKTRLKEAQVKSDDQHFKKINIDSLNWDTLNALNDCVEKYHDPFPEQVMTQGVKEMMKINPYFHTFRDDKGEAETYVKEFIKLYQDKIKEMIAADPNRFYKEGVSGNGAAEKQGEEKISAAA